MLVTFPGFLVMRFSQKLSKSCWGALSLLSSLASGGVGNTGALWLVNLAQCWLTEIRTSILQQNPRVSSLFGVFDVILKRFSRCRNGTARLIRYMNGPRVVGAKCWPAQHFPH